MNTTRFAQAPAYHPANHQGMHCLRLQGHEAGPSDALWMGVSIILPGGHTSLDASPMEKHYVVLEGEVCIRTPEETVTLGQFDSVRLAPGEAREVSNPSNRPAMLLLAMPYPATATARP
ncbi:Cupin domain-containing protein [Cupriavidus sp. OV038]|jgi:quercetin dioxygenase-like cupin family protein|uniref:cupin domain-containing protein n=1 Tax=unclassified Cupriavidus TaxID=2640874 RepID=UPI0008E23DF3|nr:MULTISPECIES: cupin domain-containing protein [unclassified Cupriavidus]SFD22391.1 Cupin domain-containing protein [Cupriavidus sp. OV038]SFP91714.1 Cupin domain-containing protein [Cupriavidus sp. OV096]